LVSKIGFGGKNMVFEDDVKRILEKHKGNVIDDSLIKIIVREYANIFNCWDVSKYYSEDNKEDFEMNTINKWPDSQICIGCKHATFIPKGHGSSAYSCNMNCNSNSESCIKTRQEATEEEWRAKF
jgi:hypothetical protein